MKSIFFLLIVVTSTSFAIKADTVSYWNFHLDDSLLLNYSYHDTEEDISIKIKQDDFFSSEILKLERIVCGTSCDICVSELKIVNQDNIVVFEDEFRVFRHKIPISSLIPVQSAKLTIWFKGGTSWDDLKEDQIIGYILLIP